MRAGIEELIAAYRDHGLGAEDFLGGRYSRIEHLRRLQAAGVIDRTLRRPATSLRSTA